MSNTEYTFSIIKPDATAKNITGKINSYLEAGGLKVVAQKMARLDRAKVEEFYGIHRERPFFNGLVNFMLSGPVVLQVLKGEDAVAVNRKIMGATNPADAEKGTIRGDFSQSIDENSVHGSDSVENAKTEIELFFSPDEIVE
jgi:nucleoside-diphosphate kinase